MPGNHAVSIKVSSRCSMHFECKTSVVEKKTLHLPNRKHVHIKTQQALQTCLLCLRPKHPLPEAGCLSQNPCPFVSFVHLEGPRSLSLSLGIFYIVHHQFPAFCLTPKEKINNAGKAKERFLYEKHFRVIDMSTDIYVMVICHLQVKSTY